jgi:hypothetical protein
MMRPGRPLLDRIRELLGRLTDTPGIKPNRFW